MKPFCFALLHTLPVAAFLALAAPASAASAEDQAAADVLFREAKTLAAANDCEHAVPKFIESQRLDPSAGTLLNVGSCYETTNKLASAYGAFREAEVLARNKGDGLRQAEAARRAEAIAPKLAKLAIVVPPAARVPGFEVKRDGALVGEGQWGSGLPVDPGHHTIEATAPGYKPWSTVMRIETNGGAAQIEIPPLQKGSTEPAAGPLATPAVPYWSGRRVAGLSVGLVGVAGLAVGAAFGAQAIAKKNDSAAQCSPTDPTFCNDAGASLRTDSKNAGNVSTGALVVGGAALVGGIVLFVTAPSGDGVKTARVEVAPWPGGLSLHGRF